MTENTIKTGGAVLFWSIGNATRIDALKVAFSEVGFPEHAPEYRAAGTVAGEAIQETIGSPLLSCTPLKDRRGWFVAEIQRGHDRNTFDDRFTLDLGERHKQDAPDVASERLAFSWHRYESDRYDIEHRIRDTYDRFSIIARTGQVTAALKDVMQSMAGTSLRPSGGIYWLPQGSALDRFAALARAVENAAAFDTKSAVYIIRHDMDTDALRAVRDAILAEITRDAAECVQATQDATTAKGAESQEARATALIAKVAEYESILGEPLPALTQLAEDARLAAAMAKLQKSAAAQRSAA